MRPFARRVALLVFLGALYALPGSGPAAPTGRTSPLRSPEEALRNIDETLRRPARSPVQKERNVQTARSMIARFRHEFPGPENRGTALVYSARCSAMLEEYALAAAQADSALAYPVASSLRTEAEFISAVAAIRSDDPQRGARILARITAGDPRHEIVPEARILLAQSLAEVGDGASAVAQLDTVIREGRPQWAVDRARALNPEFQRIGQPAPIFSARALDGSTVRLTDYRGQVVLVDFWATWCGPCRTTVPEIKRAYDDYRHRGFNVLGVSLDTNREALESFVAAYGLPWTQVYDGKGWQADVARIYGVGAIPAMFLIDRQGRIRRTNAQGADLDRLVQGLLSE